MQNGVIAEAEQIVSNSVVQAASEVLHELRNAWGPGKRITNYFDQDVILDQYWHVRADGTTGGYVSECCYGDAPCLLHGGVGYCYEEGAFGPRWWEHTK